MNQRVGIDVQANVQGVQQATTTTAAGVDNIGKAADRASAKIKQLEKNVQALIQRLEQLGKAGGRLPPWAVSSDRRYRPCPCQAWDRHLADRDRTPP